MPTTFKMVASEILMCGLKKAPFVGSAVEAIESIRSRHAMIVQADRLDTIELQLSRFERAQRDFVAEQIRLTLAELQKSHLTGPALSEEIRNLRQIHEQGWNANLFEGIAGAQHALDRAKAQPPSLRPNP